MLKGKIFETKKVKSFVVYLNPFLIVFYTYKNRELKLNINISYILRLIIRVNSTDKKNEVGWCFYLVLQNLVFVHV